MASSKIHLLFVPVHQGRLAGAIGKFRNAYLIHTLYYRFCSGSFLSISLSLVNVYYTISLLSPINSHLSTRAKILFKIIANKSSLLSRRCLIVAA